MEWAFPIERGLLAVYTLKDGSDSKTGEKAYTLPVVGVVARKESVGLARRGVLMVPAPKFSPFNGEVVPAAEAMEREKEAGDGA